MMMSRKMMRLEGWAVDAFGFASWMQFPGGRELDGRQESVSCREFLGKVGSESEIEFSCGEKRKRTNIRIKKKMKVK